MLPITIDNLRVPRNVDITLLRTFLAVTEHASMTAAGKALNLTQSAVSQHIGRLETLAGALFIRDRPGLRLTAVGERVLAKAHRIVELDDEFWLELHPQVPAAVVRLGAPYDLAQGRLTEVLRAYALDHPGVEVDLVCASSSSLARAVTEGQLDLALVEEVDDTGKGECLAVERLEWVGARHGTAHARRPLPVSMVEENCVFRPAVLAALRRSGLSWRTSFEGGSIDATRAAVRADLAVTAWLTSTVPRDLEILVDHPILPRLPPFAIGLHVARSPAPAALALAGRVRAAWTQVDDGAPATGHS